MNKNELIVEYANMAWQALCVGLDNYGIQYGADYTDITVNNSVMIMSYQLSMVNTSKWKKLQSISQEISQMVQLDADSKVRLSFNGLTYRIEVPKPTQLYNKVCIGDVYNSCDGLNVSFGLSAYSNKPNNVDFSGNGAGHMLVSGSTRCGKTNILKIIAMCLMYQNSPDNVRLAVIDVAKAKEKYAVLKNSSHLATDGIIDTTPKAETFLTWVKNTLIKLGGKQYSHKVIIIIDEIAALLETNGKQNKKIAALLKYIASAGAESGFHIISATQYTNVDDIGGRQFKGNLMTRVAGRVDDYISSKNATGRDGSGAENLMVPGDFLVVDDRGVNRIAVPEMTDRLFDRIPRGVAPIANINWTPEVSLIPESGRGPSVGKCFENIDQRLLKLAISGTMKGRYLGADKIREASYVLAKKGLGERIGQSTANEYVKFAKKYRET